MKRILIVDVERCTGCEACTATCAISKEGVFDLTRSRIQVLRDEGKGLAMPFVCEQCEEQPCVETCPVNAIEKDPEIGCMKVDSNLCTGCGSCVNVCPYNGARLNPKNNMAIICDLCEGDPLCAKACVQSRAIASVDYSLEAFKEKIEKAEQRVAYLKAVKARLGEK